MDFKEIQKRGGLILKEYISHEHGKWQVHAEDGKVLGEHDTREEAVKQLQAIEISKHKKGSLPISSADNKPEFQFGDAVSLKKDPETVGVFLKVQDDKPGDIDYLIWYPQAIEISNGKETHVVETCPVDIERVDVEISKDHLKWAGEALKEYEKKKKRYEKQFEDKVKTIVDEEEGKKKGTLINRIGIYPAGTEVVIAEETEKAFLFQVEGKHAFGWAPKDKIEVKAYPSATPGGYPAQKPAGFPAQQWASEPVKEDDVIVGRSEIEFILEEITGEVPAVETVDEIQKEFEKAYGDAYDLFQEQFASMQEEIKKAARTPEDIKRIHEEHKRKQMERLELPSEEDLEDAKELLQESYPEFAGAILKKLTEVYETAIEEEPIGGETPEEEAREFFSVPTVDPSMGSLDMASLPISAQQPKPTTPPPPGYKYAWNPDKQDWDLVDASTGIVDKIIPPGVDTTPTPIAASDVKAGWPKQNDPTYCGRPVGRFWAMPASDEREPAASVGKEIDICKILDDNIKDPALLEQIKKAIEAEVG